jgi:hypothetical protein
VPLLSVSHARVCARDTPLFSKGHPYEPRVRRRIPRAARPSFSRALSACGRLPGLGLFPHQLQRLTLTPGKFGSAGSAISTVLTFVKMFCARSFGTSWVRGVSG